ncbi:MAG: chromosomal replication initiator protein DnaA [Anaerolineae bacterium]
MVEKVTMVGGTELGPEEAWTAALGELQVLMTPATFNTWLRDCCLLAYEDGTFVLGVPNAFARDWLDNRLRSTITRTLTGIMGRSVEVRFVVHQAKGRRQTWVPVATPPPPEEEEESSLTGGDLNPRYTFENFIVGEGNRLAHAAALAVADRPGEAYNPLFLYGGVGLGKTHLLQAVGHRCCQQGLHVVYVTSEAFTNDLIAAIRTQTTEAFRDRYRQADVLLIDDIQFIAGKERTQEEFFHTFNALHAANRQVVLTSDRPPKALLTLESRLRSRFEGGLVADIQPPDLETRLAILRAKAEGQPLPVPLEVLEHIAHNILTNIRELEGALNRVVAYGRTLGRPLTLDLAVQALEGVLPAAEPPSPPEIMRLVAEYYGIPVEKVTGPGRSKEVALARQMVMFVMREEAQLPLQQIGQTLGGRDHTTVRHGCEKIRTLVETDPQVRRDWIAIRERIYTNGRR